MKPTLYLHLLNSTLSEPEIQTLRAIVNTLNQSTLDPESLQTLANHCLIELNDAQFDSLFHTLSLNPYPWPWIASELRTHLQSLLNDPPGGHHLFLALFAHYHPNPHQLSRLPRQIHQQLLNLGVYASSQFLSLPLLRSFGFSRRALLNTTLLSSDFSSYLEDPSFASHHLQIVGLPLLYRPQYFEAYEHLSNLQRGLLSQSIADLLTLPTHETTPQEPSFQLLTLGHYSSTLEQSSLFEPSIAFSHKVHLLEAQGIHPSSLAVSVSQHFCDPPFLRIALRTFDEGLLIHHVDWKGHSQDPNQSLNLLFDLLLQHLQNLGIEYCFAIQEPFHDPLLCSECSHPIIPMPIHEPWQRTLKDLDLPLDGSHRHE